MLLIYIGITLVVVINYHVIFCSCYRLILVKSTIATYVILLRCGKVLCFTIAELAITKKNALKYWHTELVKALTTAGVNENFCTNLMCQNSTSMEIGELLADTLSQYIQTSRPEELKFDIPPAVDCPIPQLQLFLREVQQHHKGKLLLQLRHSYFRSVICDDAIQALTDAR